jgi:anthranilate phosphoribosyltransferase
VVERLAREIEDATDDRAERGIARAVIGFMDVMKAYVDGEVDGDQAGAVLETLRVLGRRLRDLAGYAKLAELGSRVLELVREFD